MNIETFEDNDINLSVDIDIENDINNDIDDINDDDDDNDLIFNSGIAGFEIAYGSKNKEMIKRNFKRTAKEQYQTRQKLDSIREKRAFEKENNPFSDYWDN